VLAQGEDVIPIPGTTKLPVRPILGPVQPRISAQSMNILQNLKENIDAGKIELSPEDVQAVRDVADKANAAQGDRYPEAFMKALFADTPLP
jgi:hypothetical protein